ncbi:carbohydrate-binding protein [Ileibacterium valens]|uniref:carbohydrate-binding protein n=1 Tax=Ileibacterium valens TaxID=1862668 RepID=UPI003516C9AC
MYIYVCYDDPNNIIAVSTIATGMTTTSLLFNEGTLDVEKLEGYKVKTLEDGNHLIFDQELYDKKKKEKEEANALSNAQIKFEKIRSDIMLAQMSDEQALEIKPLYPEWQADISLKAGERIRHKDVLYRVLTAHITQETWTPDQAPSLFAKILIEDPTVIPEWEQPDSTNGYSIGDQVTHNGKTYKSLVDNNVWEPGVTGTETLWEEI